MKIYFYVCMVANFSLLGCATTNDLNILQNALTHTKKDLAEQKANHKKQLEDLFVSFQKIESSQNGVFSNQNFIIEETRKSIELSNKVSGQLKDLSSVIANIDIDKVELQLQEAKLLIEQAKLVVEGMVNVQTETIIEGEIEQVSRKSKIVSAEKVIEEFNDNKLRAWDLYYHQPIVITGKVSTIRSSYDNKAAYILFDDACRTLKLTSSACSIAYIKVSLAKTMSSGKSIKLFCSNGVEELEFLGASYIPSYGSETEPCLLVK